MTRSTHLTLAALLLTVSTLLFAQTDTTPGPHGTVERIKVHGKSLEGNLEGDSPDREVLVYLPVSYKTSGARRYPVVYMLHGFTDDPDNWWGFKKHFISIPAVLDKAFADGSTREMILVMPNAYTTYLGSMYSNSVTTGNWEDYVAKDLVAYIDSHYRTLTDVASRGLAGHSMGGYGAVRIGMKHPEVFSSWYALSPCCLTPPEVLKPPASWASAESIKAPADVTKREFPSKIVIAEAAAWSPNPENSPLFFDLPTKNGELQPQIAAKWAANAPVALVDQYVSNLKRTKAIAIDIGLQDNLIAGVKVLDQALTSVQVPHTYETYEGNHTNHVADRVEQKVMPFFSKNLSFTQPKR